MDLEKVKLSLVKYNLKIQLYIGSSTVHEVPNELMLSMNITEDYEQYIFPYFEIDIGVPNSVYRQMKANNQSIKAMVLLQKGKFKEGVSVSTDSSVAFKNVFHQSFFVFLDDTTPELTETEQKLVEKSENKYGDIAVVRLLLYQHSFYTSYDLVVNKCLSNVTLVDVLTFLLNKCNVGNVLLSPPTNYTRFKQFILTPIPLKDQLERVCNTYSLHSAGTLIYFSFDRLYLIDKVPRCTAFTPNEHQITYIVTSTETQGTSQVGGCYENSGDRYGVLNATNLNFKNKMEYTSKTIGTNIVSVDSEGTITKNTSNLSSVTNVVIQEDGDKHSLSSVQQTISESKRVLYVSFSNIDISMMTPNRQFVVTIEGVSKQKQYNGKYRIVKAAHIFEKEGNYFSVKTTAEFRGK